jgi:diguanylate cyclase (GGDEF)-like protein/PAS domain S-box-containing protein
MSSPVPEQRPGKRPGKRPSRRQSQRRVRLDGSVGDRNGVALAEGSGSERIKLTRKWAYLLGTSAYIPLSQSEIEHELLAMVNRLMDAMDTEPAAAAEAVGEVGARMVALNCVGRESLARTLELFGCHLLTGTSPQRVDRTLALLAALSTGYVNAIRLFVQEQQESLNRALAKSVRDVKRDLRTSEKRFNEVFAVAGSGMAISDLDGHLLRINRPLAAILEGSDAELTSLTLFDLVAEDDAGPLREAFEDMLAGKGDRLRQWPTLMRQDGTSVAASMSVSLLRDAAGRPSHCVAIVQDDGETALLQGQLRHQSLHDVLTGLPNRQYFLSNLERALRRADPVDGVTLYRVDIDAFSVVNNGLGAAAGNTLLRTVAERLKAVVAAEPALVARFEADRFGILVENRPATPGVLAMVSRIQEELAEPVYVDGKGLAASVTIGVVDRPSANSDPVELMRAAEMTIRRVRTTGRGQWGLRDPEREERDREWSALAASVPGGWETGEFDVDYRSLVRLDDLTAGPLGVEAALSWDHPELGRIGHRRCDELAEQIGLSVPMGRWLLRSAAERVPDDHALSVALTPNQAADPDLVGVVRRITAETGRTPDSLRLGFPVLALVTDRGEAVDNLRVLAELGVWTVAHEFGSATEHLVCLEDLPVREVRVAESLVRRQARKEGSSLIDRVLTDLVAVAHTAGVAVSTDHIETEAQARWWRAAGADIALGPLFAPATL